MGLRFKESSTFFDLNVTGTTSFLVLSIESISWADDWRDIVHADSISEVDIGPLLPSIERLLAAKAGVFLEESLAYSPTYASRSAQW